MDEIVLKSMAKWPDVPDVFGWMVLDARGNWLIKDQRIGNPAIGEFIGRNYQSDERGRWYFQNGPQRVFVTLANTPFVLSTRPGTNASEIVTHTGITVEKVTGAWLDENSSLLLRFRGGEIGSVDDRDLSEISTWFCTAEGRPIDDEAVSKAMERHNTHGATGIWLAYGDDLCPVGRIAYEQAPTKFGFDRSPRPEPGQPDC